MDRFRASWDYEATKKLLDLCIQEKNLCNFTSMGASAVGWSNISKGLKEAFGNRFDQRQASNKLATLKRSYMKWLGLQKQTGLGRDQSTGGVSADDSFWQEADGAPNSPDDARGTPPPFVDELAILFGRTPQDRGNLLCAGGVPQRSETAGSDESPQGLSQGFLGGSSTRPSAGKRSRDVTVDSPTKKMSRSSMEEAVQLMAQKVVERADRRLKPNQQQMQLVSQQLREDGIEEGSELYFKALMLCKDELNRAQFLDLSNHASRVGWIHFNWANK